MSRSRLLDVALHRARADLVITGGTLVNVHTGEAYAADVATVGADIAVVGDVDAVVGPATGRLDATGLHLTPGLIDAHIHTYESHLSVGAVSSAMLARGVTTIATDFYGEGVVGGIEAIRASLAAAADVPLNVLFTVPMPAFYQDLPFEHTGSLDAGDMRAMLAWDECIGINECFAPLVMARDEVLLDLMERARRTRKALCGHGSETTGRSLMGWAALGGYLDDHECIDPDEVAEKARLGIRIVLREGSAAADVRTCLPAITERGLDPRRFAFCSDLLSPVDLVRRGNIDRCVRLAVEAGVPMVDALRMGTLNAAETLGVDAWLGAVAPGKRADICLVRDPGTHFHVEHVVAGGRVVVRDGTYVGPRPGANYPPEAHGTVRLRRPPAPEDLRIATHATERVRVRVIEATDGTIVTSEGIASLPVSDGAITADPENDVLKIASFERHRRTGRVGCGFVRGFGLRSGAIASTYNPHCQHLIAVGGDDGDMLAAARAVHEMGGGFAVVENGSPTARVPLPLYGLLSERPAADLVEEIEAALAAARDLGCGLSAPFHTLAFVGLPVVIGRLKISSEGLVDVWGGRTVPLEINDEEELHVS
jgi:adenine deaminase